MPQVEQLSPKKCTGIWLITSGWQVNGSMQWLRRLPATLQVQDAEGNMKVLCWLPVEVAECTLGVRIALDGNMEDEAKFLEEVAKDWADNIQTGHLPRDLSWQSLTTTVLKKLEYSLPATTLTEAQCKQIMKPLLKVGLLALGVIVSFPRALVFGPEHFQGLAFPHLYTLQGLAHIYRLLKFGSSAEHMTSKLMRQSMEILKIEVGIPGPVLFQSYECFGHLATDSWLKHTWRYLWDHGLRIKDDLPDLTLQ